MKKFISLLMVIVMTFGCLITNSSAVDSFSVSGSIAEKIAAEPENYDLARSASGQSNLLTYYLTEEAENGKKYPDYYGGMYTDDNGNLIVNVTELTPEVEGFIKNFTRNKKIEIRLVDTSFNDLVELMNSISDKCDVEYAGYHAREAI